MSGPESRLVGLRCRRCGAGFGPEPMFEGCPACRDGDWAANLVCEYDLAAARADWDARRGTGLWRYRAFLPVGAGAPVVTLGEGGTPLLPLPAEAGWRRLWLKNESANPTWSYKDRLNAVAASHALGRGATTVAVSSTGNHGASAAAYAAAAGLRAVAFTRAEVDPLTLQFMQVYGASVLRTSRRGRWELLRHGVREFGWYPVSTYTPAPTGNPYGVEGYKTLAFELVEQLGVPDVVVLPTSYGEGLAGIWAGFALLREIGVTDRVPRMVAAEPAAGAPLAGALDRGADRVGEVAAFGTVALSIGAVTATDAALHALRASGGTAVRVGDAELLDAQLRLARSGVLLEPSGVAGYAALAGLAGRLSDVDPATACCVVVGTGGGLRSLPLLAERLPDAPLVEPTPEVLGELVGSARPAPAALRHDRPVPAQPGKPGGQRRSAPEPTR